MPVDPNQPQNAVPPGPGDAPLAEAPSLVSATSRLSRLGSPVKWAFMLILLVFGLIFMAIAQDAPLIRRLSDAGFARGLITFIICIATIGLAFVLIFQALSTHNLTDEGFRRGREVFTGLMGVLGTIVGFYFGSADKGEALLDLAPIKRVDKQLVTHVSGGAKPYIYSITSSENGFQEIKKVTEDGWVSETLAQEPSPGSTITIKVTDSRGREATQKIAIPKSAEVGQPTQKNSQK